MYSVQHLSQKPPQELKALHSTASYIHTHKNSFLKYSLYRKNKYRFKAKRCFTLHHSRVILLVFILQRIRKQFHVLICTGIIIQSDTACNHLPNKTQSEGIVWQSTCVNSEKSTTSWPYPRKNGGNKSITTQSVAAMKISELEFKFGLRSKLYRCCFHLISYKNNTQPFKTLFFLIRLISLCVIRVYVSVGEHSISVFPCWANDSSKQDSLNSRPKFFKATVSRFLCFGHKGHVAGMLGLGQIPIHLIQLLWRSNEHLPSGWSILSRKVFLT